MKLFETSLPQMYSKSLFEEQYLDLAEEHCDKIFDVLFTGVGTFLNKNKSTTKPTAFVVKAANGSVVCAAIVKYFPNETDPSQPGNWSYVWTFDEADIPEDALVVALDDAKCHSHFIAAGGTKYGIKFVDSACLINTISYAPIQLKKWLDENAKEGTEVVIELDGVFQARVAVNNGEKEFAIEPIGEAKNVIKSDDMIESK